MNTPVTLEVAVNKPISRFYEVTVSPEYETVALNRIRNNELVAGFSKEEAIAFAKEVLIGFQVPFCLRVKE